MSFKKVSCTCKSLSEALIFASINPQYDKRLFMELPLKNKCRIWAEHGQCSFHGNSMNNFLSYCGLLVDARINASEKDLPVLDLNNTIKA